MKRLVSLAAVIVAITGSGCASFHQTFGKSAPLVCALAGGAAGAGIGIAASNWRHNEDRDHEWRRGALIGGGSGAVLGATLCYLTAPKGGGPSVRATANPDSGAPPLAVDFRCLAESGAGIKSYHWDFGDGSSADTQNANHTYRTPGNYTAVCTATDNDNMSSTAQAPVSVGAAAAAPTTRKSIVLRGINFDFNKADIKAEAEPVLDAAADVLKENAGVRVRVSGHTDSVGGDAYNQALSERRANAVRDYLVSHGVDASRLTTVGFGESQPVADNKTADGRAQNRRVALDVE